MSTDERAGGWADKPANLDEYLQGKLNKDVPQSQGSWGGRFQLEEYRGSLCLPIWEAFGHLYDSFGDPSGTYEVATTERAREIDFRMETFAAATAITPQGSGRNWIIMGSARQKFLLESDETHAERKILAAMEPPEAERLTINSETVDAMFARAGLPSAGGPPSKKVDKMLRGRKRWLGAFEGGWTDTLMILVTRSPCTPCSEALVRALGEGEQHHYRHLVVAFCTYYKGGVGENAMPATEFCNRVGDENAEIELFKVHWRGATDDFLRSRQLPHEPYWHTQSAATLRTHHPLNEDGMPHDPRYTIYRLTPR